MGLFCEFANKVPLNVVHEFYANAKVEKNDITVVRGMSVDYSPRAIRTLLGPRAKPKGAVDWSLMKRDDVDLDVVIAELCIPGTVWKFRPGTTERTTFPSSSLTKFARVWFLFICSNIIPSSHVADVTVERAILLWGILKGEYVDLGNLINQNIHRFLGGPSSAGMPHASIITKLCDIVGVRGYEDEPVQSAMAPIDDVSISRMAEWSGGVPHPRGLGYLVGGAGTSGQGADAPPRVPRVPRASRAGPSQGSVDMSALDTHFRRFNRRIDAMHASNREFDEDMTASLCAAFQSMGTTVQWPVFGARTQYPPPDSPEEGDDADE